VSEHQEDYMHLEPDDPGWDAVADQVAAAADGWPEENGIVD